MDLEEVNDSSFSILTYGQLLSDSCNAQLSLVCMWIHLYHSIRSKRREIIRWQSGTMAQVSLFLPTASQHSETKCFPCVPLTSQLLQLSNPLQTLDLTQASLHYRLHNLLKELKLCYGWLPVYTLGTIHSSFTGYVWGLLLSCINRALAVTDEDWWCSQESEWGEFSKFSIKMWFVPWHFLTIPAFNS